MMVSILHGILKKVVEFLQKPVPTSWLTDVSPPTQPMPALVLTEAQIAHNAAVDAQIGQLFVELLRFYHIPIDRLLSFSFMQSAATTLFSKVGAVIRELCTGDLIIEAIEVGLITCAEQKLTKMPVLQKKQKAAQERADLKTFEAQIAKELLQYPLRMIGAIALHLSAIVKEDSALGLMRQDLVSLTETIFNTLLPAIMRTLKLDRLIAAPLTYLLHAFDERTIGLLSSPDLLESMIYKGIEHVGSTFEAH